jgi:hypothetical protein
MDMHHNTIDDRARKSRIREREYRQFTARLRKLDNITEEQLAVLKKIKAAEAKNKPLKSKSVENWRDLRAMGVVKESDEGTLVLTSMGVQVVSSEESK